MKSIDTGIVADTPTRAFEAERRSGSNQNQVTGGWTTTQAVGTFLPDRLEAA
jgi:hypothetical protein